MDIYLIIVITLVLSQYLFKVVIELVNLLNITNIVPPLFEKECPPDKYKLSQQYLKENTWLDLIESTFFTIVLFAMILLGGFNALDQYVRGYELGNISTGLIFFALLFFAQTILNLPFQIYDTFVIEEKYGFNRTSVKTFILDFFKHAMLFIVLGGAIGFGILWLFETAGPLAWLYAWVSLIVCQLILTYVGPTWIMPLFNKFTPMEESELKSAIEEYANKVGFAMKGVFTMDNSIRSTKSNAYFTGFGKNRRVVLFDTLINGYSIEELVSILAHEIGHFKNKHIIKLFAFGIISQGIMLYALSWFINNPNLFHAFGIEHLSIYASMLIFAILYSPVQTLLGIFVNALSRRFEYEADDYAVKTYQKPEAFIAALKKLSLEHLSNLTPHPWKVAISYSHPTVIQRANAIHKKLEANP